MNLMEQFESNVQLDYQVLAKYGTSYRERTSYLANELLHQLLQEESDRLFEFTQEDYVNLAEVYLSEDQERLLDVGKFLYMHKQELLSQDLNRDLYQRAEELANKALGLQ